MTLRTRIRRQQSLRSLNAFTVFRCNSYSLNMIHFNFFVLDQDRVQEDIFKLNALNQMNVGIDKYFAAKGSWQLEMCFILVLKKLK